MIFNILKGFAKLALVEIKAIEKRPFATKRWNICEPCDMNKNNICSGCGCYIPAKILLSSEKCPAKKW